MPEEAFTVSTPTGELAAWRGGTGAESAVLLHGGPGLPDYLDTLVPFLARRFRTIRYQQRGVAPTTVAGPATVDTHVEDAIAVIDQAADGRAWIVGHSWGGHLALHLLVACPERLAGAIIVDALCADVGVMQEFGATLRAGLDERARRRYEEIEAREQAGEATLAESLEAFALVWPHYFADPAAAPPFPFTQFDIPGYLETFASIWDHAERGTLTTGLPRVPATVPVRFIVGAKSPFPERTTPETARLIPHATVAAAENGGHFPWLDDPDGFAAALDM
jgi:pimeloyl-ACP methyl ester carboxylesterase